MHIISTIILKYVLAFKLKNISEHFVPTENMVDADEKGNTCFLKIRK